MNEEEDNNFECVNGFNNLCRKLGEVFWTKIAKGSCDNFQNWKEKYGA